MTVLQDLRFAFRMLLKDRWFTVVAATALGLGIGVNTTVFTFVNAVLIRGLPFDQPHEIVYLATRNTTRGASDSSAASWYEFEEWRANAKSFVGLAAFRFSQGNISDADHPAERFGGAMVSANTFSLLRQQPFLGRNFSPHEDAAGAAPVVILGYRVWKNRYDSDPNIVGRSIKINEVACTIVGVMPEGMRFPTNADWWRPLQPLTGDEARNRSTSVFGRLAPGVGWDQASAEMATISLQLQTKYAETNKDIVARMMTFNERFNGGEIRLIFLSLLGAVGFVLLIACANVANLLLARSAYRAREIAVRTALGAARGAIVRQLLIESVLLACIGGLLGLALAALSVRLFDAAVADVGKPYWIVFSLDYAVFGYFAAICLTTGIVFGLAPALQASKTNLNELMKEGGRGQSGGARARWLTSSLVVFELALTLALLTGAGLMMRSFLKLYSFDAGFDTQRLLTFRTQLVESRYPKPEQRQLFWDSVVTRVRALPGVTNAAVASAVPFGGTGRLPVEIEGRPAPPEGQQPEVSTVDVGPGYFETLGVAVQRGRTLGEADGSAGQEVIVINQRMATTLFPNEEPLGKRIRLLQGARREKPGPWLTIVGVSPTIRQGDLRELEPSSVIYRPTRLSPPLGTAVLVRSTGDPVALGQSVREAVREIAPDQPLFAVQPLNDVLAEQRWPYRVFGTMFAIFAVIALVLSSVGIYAITSYSVSQRTQELGLRLALGAQPAQIAWLILRTGLVQLAIGLSLGLIAAFLVTFLLRPVVAQIPAADPVTFLAITLLLTVTMLVASLLPARRATRMDPAKTLQS